MDPIEDYGERNSPERLDDIRYAIEDSIFLTNETVRDRLSTKDWESLVRLSQVLVDLTAARANLISAEE